MKSYPLLALVSLVCQAQTSLSLRDAVSQALRTHPLLAAGSERIAAAEGLRVQSSYRPNPRIILQTENLRAHGEPGFKFSDQADTYAYFSQLIETAGKRDRRVEVASANVRRAELERELLERQIAGRVKLAYWNAAGAQKAYELLLDTIRNFRQIVDYHEARVREGAMAEVDLLRVRLEGERLDLAANSAALEAERARIALFREMGQSQFPAVMFTEPLERMDGDLPSVDPARALAERTEVKLARLEAERARANLRLQKAAAKPDLDVLAGYKRAAGFHTLLAGVQVSLPVANRNQGNIVAAGREVRVAEASLAAVEALVAAEVQAARRDFEIRRRQVLEALPALRDRASESSRISLAAYREGGADLLRLLDSERVRFEIQLLYYRALADYQQSKVALETAMGVAP